MSVIRRRVLPGMLLGFVLSWLGFGDYAELHAMFTLADLRLVGVFGGAVLLNGAFMAAFGLRRVLAPVAISAQVVLGGVLFGLGWVISSGCPGIVLVQLGEGRLPALASLLGMSLGAALVARLRKPELQLTPGVVTVGAAPAGGPR